MRAGHPHAGKAPTSPPALMSQQGTFQTSQFLTAVSDSTLKDMLLLRRMPIQKDMTSMMAKFGITIKEHEDRLFHLETKFQDFTAALDELAHKLIKGLRFNGLKPN